MAFSCHFETNAENGLQGLKVFNGTCVRIANCYQSASQVIFAASTQSSLYQNNLNVIGPDDPPYPAYEDEDSNLAEHNY